MSGSSSTYIVGIGPSGSSQLTVSLTTPSTATATPSIVSTTTTTTTSTTPTTTSTTSRSTMSSISSPAASATGATTPSAASRTPNLGAIIGGTIGGVALLLWFLGLLWFAHRHSWFRRPGYRRQRDEQGMFGKRSPAITPTTESAGPFGGNRPPQPQTGVGARTFGEPSRISGYASGPPPKTSFGDPPRTSYGEPPRTSYGEPPRTSYGEPPRTSFGQPQRASFGPLPAPAPMPPQPKSKNFNDTSRSAGFGDRPRSGFGERPISGFGDRERPRSGFGDAGRRSMSPERSRRGFFGGRTDSNEWEGAGRRIGAEPGTPEMGERGGVWGLLARARDHAARKKRVKAEYEEDMRRMRVRSVGEPDYGRY